MRVSSDTLLVERVRDGVVLHNLRPGLWIIPASFYPYFRAMYESGGMWPYDATAISYDSITDTITILITE